VVPWTWSTFYRGLTWASSPTRRRLLPSCAAGHTPKHCYNVLLVIDLNRTQTERMSAVVSYGVWAFWSRDQSEGTCLRA